MPAVIQILFTTAQQYTYFRRFADSEYLHETAPAHRLLQSIERCAPLRSVAPETVSDIRASEVMISADSDVVSSTSTSKEIEYARCPDGASNEPLLRE